MKIITICWSIEFTPKIAELKKHLENMWYKVNIPLTSEKILNKEMSFDDFLNTKTDLEKSSNLKSNNEVIKKYYKKINDSDAILVLNEEKKWIKNYIWWNTFLEMWFAYVLEKPIFLYNPIPANWERMHYVDEIMSMKPIIINWDLDIVKKVMEG